MKVMNSLSQINLIKAFVRRIFPLVDEELNVYLKKAERIPCYVLSEQAKNSIETKKFHCQGGAIYALYPGVNLNDMIHFIVSYQTISDYLDNLCDRAQVTDERAFRELHQALSDALDPSEDISEYYRYYPYKDDGGYLVLLINECKRIVRRLPAYDLIRDRVLFLARLYSDLQVYKHLDTNIRETKMEQWFEKYVQFFPEISGWEFSAATGSTLCTFMLIAAAMDEKLLASEVGRIFDAYFPWICGLHILLDYYIDLNEDMMEGDLNFVSYYEDNSELENRMKLFLEKALESSGTLKYPLFHRTVVEGLMGMYLSDPKANTYECRTITRKLLKQTGYFAELLYSMCLDLRRKHKL